MRNLRLPVLHRDPHRDPHPDLPPDLRQYLRQYLHLGLHSGIVRLSSLRSLAILLIWLLVISGTNSGQQPAAKAESGAQQQQEQADPGKRGRELVAAARAAIGPPEAWRELQSLSISGRLRRFVKYVSVQAPNRIEQKEKVLNGKLRLDFLLPDRFWRRVSNSTLNGFNYSYTQVVNGDRAWRHPAPLVSSHRDSRIYDIGDIERSFEIHAHDARQQIAFYTLGWLLQLPPSFPAEFIHAGPVKIEGRHCEAVVVRGPNGFNPALLIDSETHLPYGLLITYVDARRETVVVEVASVSRQFIAETYARARREREARRRPPQRREMLWRFSDHQEVGGLRLPHRITTLLDGVVLEELTVPEFRLNREIKAKKFEGQPEIKFD